MLGLRRRIRDALFLHLRCSDRSCRLRKRQEEEGERHWLLLAGRGAGAASGGDKGDSANVGIFARKPEYVPILDAEVTEEAVAKWFAHRIKGKVTRWRLPGIGGFNFLMREALGGGGMASLKADPLAKAFAQMLLDMPVRVPASLADARDTSR